MEETFLDSRPLRKIHTHKNRLWAWQAVVCWSLHYQLHKVRGFICIVYRRSPDSKNGDEHWIYTGSLDWIKVQEDGTSLVVQWLRLHYHYNGTSSIPGGGSFPCHEVWPNTKRKEKEKNENYKLKKKSVKIRFSWSLSLGVPPTILCPRWLPHLLHSHPGLGGRLRV